MRESIRKILKEDRVDQFINHVATDFMRGYTVNDITIDFESSGELRDLGWDDEMLSFAYEQYGDYGFTQDPEDEDSFYYEGSDHIWDIEEVLMDMFYIFIEERVKTGEFIETYAGWEIRQNMWEIVTNNNRGYIIDWLCDRKKYNVTFNMVDLENRLIKKYGVPEDILVEVTDEIVRRMITILDNEKKFC